MMRRPTSRHLAIALVALFGLLGLLGSTPVMAATYSVGDVIYVVYQPNGTEFVVNLGAKEQFTQATSSFPVVSFTGADISDAFGGTVPSDLRVAIFSVNERITRDGYLATNGPNDAARVGNAIGAVNSIQSFSGLWAFVSTPVATNPNAGTLNGSGSSSYQSRLNRAGQGSLAGTVPFNIETPLASAPVSISFYSGRSNPFSGVAPQSDRIGSFQLNLDGTLVFFPDRTIAATCVANPGTINTKANGAGFSVDVSLFDVTDPNGTFSIPLSRMDPVHISSVAGVDLPVPSAATGCDSATQDGIWETPSLRTLTTLYYATPSDGVCDTLDGNRQDIIALVAAVPDNSTVPVCFASSVDGNPVSCCAPLRVRNKGLR